VPIPCAASDDQNCVGPFRVAFTVATPGGWNNTNVTDPTTGQVVSTVLGDALRNAFNNHAAAFTANLRGSWLETVYCGTPSRVRNGPLLDTAGSPATWLVEVWVNAPNGLSPYYWDYAWVARMWMDSLDTVPLPAGAGNATLTPGQVAVAVNGRFAETLPADYPAQSPTGLVLPTQGRKIRGLIRYENIAATGPGANASYTSAINTTHTIAAIPIADPGFPYRLLGRAAMRITDVAHQTGYISHIGGLAVNTQVMPNVSGPMVDTTINAAFLGIVGPSGAGDSGFVRLDTRRAPGVFTGANTVYFLFRNGAWGTCTWGPLNSQSDYYVQIDVEPANL
jgi:hypothetical protein